jgi:CBS domain-containing protein
MPVFVRNIMTPYEELVILNPSDSIDKAHRIMRERNIHSVLVKKSKSSLYWLIFTDTDLMAAQSSSDGDENDVPVGDWANIATKIAKPDWTCEKAREVMLSNGVKHLPVMDDAFQLLGIISSRDIIEKCHSSKY